MNKKSICLAVVSTLLAPCMLMAQSDKVKFGAVSRTFIESDELKNDTVNASKINSGYTLVDLGLNINPDRNTEIQSVIRFKSDIGGFYGGGTLIELRQLRVKGVIARFLNYEVGDLHMQLSPYTLFNNYSEGSVNESVVFSDLRNDIAYYDNRNTDNRWWQQGAHTDFALEFKETFIKSFKVDGFFLRNRPVGGILGGSAVFYGGGKLTVNQSKYFTINGNFINLYDDGSTINSKKETQNPVMSSEVIFKLDKGNYQFQLMGEAGASQLNVSKDPDKFSDTASSYKDNFFDIAFGIDLKPSNLSFKIGYNYVGPNFFSAGAQSKRVDYTRSPMLFPNVANNSASDRIINLFDLTRDSRIYNTNISRQLMTYNPVFGNAMPYGKATPNRKGITLDAMYKDSLEKVIVNVTTALLSDISGEGTTDHKNFTVVKGDVTININRFFTFSRIVTVTAGAMMENTARTGVDAAKADKIDLKSMLMDFGVQVELVKKLDVLGGVKLFNSKGNEFYAARDMNNQITAFNGFAVDQKQSLIGYGLKYRFSKFSYLSLQNQMFSYKDGTGMPDYSFNQLYVMFNMKL